MGKRAAVLIGTGWALIAASDGAMAQQIQDNAAVPVIAVPTPDPVLAIVPSPTPTPTPTATPTPRARRPVAAPTPVEPRTRAKPAAPALARPTPVAETTPLPVPPRQGPAAAPYAAHDDPASPPPAPQPTSAPARPAAAPTLATPTDGGAVPAWWWWGGAAILLAGLAAIGRRLLPRRDRRDAAAPGAPVAGPEIAPVAVPATPRARLTVEVRPTRAGLNLLSATCEAEAVIRNVGDAPAENIRVEMRLLDAHADLDADLAQLWEAAAGRPAVAPFALAPREGMPVSAIVALPRESIRSLTATGRPMMIPVFAVNLRYDSAGTAMQTAQAFVVGVERVDSSKLAPFWLDVAPRMFTNIAVRAHAPALERDLIR